MVVVGSVSHNSCEAAQFLFSFSVVVVHDVHIKLYCFRFFIMVEL